MQSYPTTILYENGEEIVNLRGIKNTTLLSQPIEAALEKAKPGTRPSVVELPEPGDTIFPKPKSTETEELPSAESKVAENDPEATLGGAADKTAEASPDKPVAEPADKSEVAEKGTNGDATGNVKESKLARTETGSEKPQDKEVEKKFGDDWKVPSTGEMLKKTKLKVSASKYNLDGASVPLIPESFERLIIKTQDPWFIKFYAPWCSHCKALAPTWEQLGKKMQGKLNIGEVNCEAESKLCKEMSVHGFPTIYFMKGSERVEYKGLRGIGDFVEYAERALEVAGGIPDVNETTFKEMEKSEEVVFLYFYDHATTIEDFKALDALPLNLIGRAKIAKTNDAELCKRFKITTWPRLMVSREGRATYYVPITPDEMRDVDAMLDWMKSAWLPLVPELTATNARQIMDHKIVALAILNRDDGRFQKSIYELKSAAGEWMDRQIQEFQLERKRLRDAKQSRIEEAEERDDQRALRNAKAMKIDMDSGSKKEVGFAWVDGIFWQKWLRNTYGIDVREGERVIINEEDVSLTSHGDAASATQGTVKVIQC